MREPGVADVVARVSDAAFGRPLVTNVLRGHVAEAIVALALEPEWRWCSADYCSWDFERTDGLRLEVKQSARLQTWDTGGGAQVRPSFDVRERTGRWEQAAWIAEPGRPAHLYLFCYHGRCNPRTDHRDPEQWEFFVVPAAALPPVKRLALGSVSRLAIPCGYPDLRDQVQRAASGVALARSSQSASVETVRPVIVADVIGFPKAI